MLKIGDIVRVIDDKQYENLEGKPDLKLGEICSVHNLLVHNGCVHVDVGKKTDKNYIRCKHTLENLDLNLFRQNTEWCSPDRFELVQK